MHFSPHLPDDAHAYRVAANLERGQPAMLVLPKAWEPYWPLAEALSAAGTPPLIVERVLRGHYAEDWARLVWEVEAAGGSVVAMMSRGEEMDGPTGDR